MYDVHQLSLDAHCSCRIHHCKTNACRLNRGTSERSSAKGRPVGLLIAWLLAERPCQQSHKNMLKAKTRTAQDLTDLSLEKRITSRDWARANGLAVLFEYERPRKKDRKGNFLEPEEPLHAL